MSRVPKITKIRSLSPIQREKQKLADSRAIIEGIAKNHGVDPRLSNAQINKNLRKLSGSQRERALMSIDALRRMSITTKKKIKQMEK